jgi:hypothetical protein
MAASLWVLFLMALFCSLHLCLIVMMFFGFYWMVSIPFRRMSMRELFAVVAFWAVFSFMLVTLADFFHIFRP